MKPTAIQIATDLHFEFKSAVDAAYDNPSQAVFTLESVISLLVKYGHPTPDFAGHALQVSNGNADENKANLRKVGGMIEKARKALGLTITQLAERTGKKPPVVAYWESGKANLELTTLLLIQKHLPVKIVDIK